MRKIFAAVAFATIALTAGSVHSQAAAKPDAKADAKTAAPAFWSWQERPTLGWNSWDCFGAGVTEEQTLANAEYMAKNLKSHGYDLITVDIQWYEPRARTTNYRPNAVLEMDANGRLLPAPNRFPSTAEARSFKPLADKIHAMGLRFGIHLMRGVPKQAVRDKTPILGTKGLTAADIASANDDCPWNTDMHGVDMTKPGAQEYYDSVFALIASWGVDFVKVDDLSARIYHKAEIEGIRKAIDKSGRKMTFSTSPGATPLAEGEHVEMHANQWRVSDDFWDTDWRLLWEQFKRLDDWTPYRAAGHFPDADMLPVGNVRAWTNNGWTNFTHDEQITMMNLWSIARSPLIIGGNLPKNDEFTLGLLTNDEMLKVNQHSTNNHQLFRNGDQVAWVADSEDGKSKYVALFNATTPPARGRGGRGRRGGAAGATTTTQGARATPMATATPTPVPTPGNLTVSVPTADLKIEPGMKVIGVRDVWAHKDLEASKTVSAVLAPHASALFEVRMARGD